MQQSPSPLWAALGVEEEIAIEKLAHHAFLIGAHALNHHERCPDCARDSCDSTVDIRHGQ